MFAVAVPSMADCKIKIYSVTNLYSIDSCGRKTHVVGLISWV